MQRVALGRLPLFFRVFDIVNLASFCSLRDNGIGDEGAIGLGKALEINTGLTKLV